MVAGAGGAGVRAVSNDDRFFLVSALLMMAVIFAGFSVQLAMGRSTFAASAITHVHALVFMGWVVIFALQTAFATVGPLSFHRKLGWLGAAWMVPMAVLGPALTIDRVRAGRVPFFFEPQHFLFANPMTMLAFLTLTGAAIVLRHRTDWHRRLHLCGMAALMGPGFGRLLPMPLMEPFAFQSAVVAGFVFPLAGVIVDIRRGRGVHPAWKCGFAVLIATLVLTELIARSPLGAALYTAVTAGTPGAQIAPMAFAAPPGP